MLFKPKFVYHKKLESHVWDSNNHMRPAVRDALLEFINLFFLYVQRLNIPFDMSGVRDIFIHGSITNYYYNNQSDIDVCVWCDFNNLSKKLSGINIATLLKNVAKALTVDMEPSICGRKIDIVFADPEQLRNVEGIHKGSGNMYSIMNDKWIRMSPRLNKTTIQSMYAQATNIAIDMAVHIRHLVKHAQRSDDIVKYINQKLSIRTNDAINNYAQPITPMIIAFRMVRNMGLLDLAYERVLKLRVSEQMGEKNVP